MEESSVYQAILRRGRSEGRQEGRLEEARATLLRIGLRKWGPAAPEIVAAVESITDVQRLETLQDAIEHASGWEQLLES